MSKFIMLIGIAGSGKSTIAEQLSDKDTFIVSSDELRKVLYNDENDQTHNKQVFEEMNRRTKWFLNNGYSVIYDATNINARRRCELLNWLASETNAGVKYDSIAVSITCSTEEAISRQSKRERKVPSDVIERMSRRLQKPTYAEGWDRIYEVASH